MARAKPKQKSKKKGGESEEALYSVYAEAWEKGRVRYFETCPAGVWNAKVTRRPFDKETKTQSFGVKAYALDPEAEEYRDYSLRAREYAPYAQDGEINETAMNILKTEMANLDCIVPDPNAKPREVAKALATFFAKLDGANVVVRVWHQKEREPPHAPEGWEGRTFANYSIEGFPEEEE